MTRVQPVSIITPDSFLGSFPKAPSLAVTPWGHLHLPVGWGCSALGRESHSETSLPRSFLSQQRFDARPWAVFRGDELSLAPFAPSWG